MQILVAGSLHHLNNEELQRLRLLFQSICQAIGAQIAYRKHSLIVGTDSENCADRYFAEGAVNSGLPVRLTVVRPLSGNPAFANWKTREGVVSLDRKVSAASRWFDARSYQVRNADAIILIGGCRGVEDVFEQATIFGRPVLPLGFVGGAAKNLVERLHANRTITKNAVAMIGDESAWHKSTSPQQVLDLLEELVKAQSIFRRVIHFGRALRRYGSKLAKIVLSIAQWLVVAAAGAAIGVLVKEHWKEILNVINI